MTNRRLTIGNSPGLQRLLRGRVADDQSPTQVITRAVARYDELCRHHLPVLDGPQWNVIFDALNGWGMLAEREVQFAEHEIADAIRMDGADKRHGADGTGLMAAMRTWRYAEWVAVVDAAERFWARHKERDVHGDPRQWPDPQESP